MLTAGLVAPVWLSLPVWKAVGVSCGAAGSYWPPSQVGADCRGVGEGGCQSEGPPSVGAVLAGEL